MNKYDRKLFEIAPEDATIYELARKEIKSDTDNVLDFLFYGIFSFLEGVKGLKNRCCTLFNH